MPASGGNQQKAIIGREPDRENPLLIAVQPTRGLDVGAIEYIHSQLVAQRTAGKAVLPVSPELDEVMIFGNWNPTGIALFSLLFGLFKCVAAAYSTLDINGDGVYMLAELGISSHLYRMLPYLVTLVVLAFTSKKSRAPKAEGIPYDKGSRGQ